MKLTYDRAALQEYMDDINGAFETLRRTKDEAVRAFSSCKAQYARLYTEIEQRCRSAYNKVEAAESYQRQADTEYELAMRMLEDSYDDDDEDSTLADEARRRLDRARDMQADAAAEMAEATEEYKKAQEKMDRLKDVWDKYAPSAESAADKAEEGVFSFSTITEEANSGLGTYMTFMELGQSALYEGSSAVSGSEGASSGGSGSLSSAVAFAGAVSGATRGRGNSQTHSFRSNAGNVLGVAAATGIVMSLAGGGQQTFPFTKSGAAKAYRAALKSGDNDLAEQANFLFENFETLSPETPPNQQYVSQVMDELSQGIQETFDRETVLAGAETRKMRTPRTETSCGKTRGSWEGDTFYMDDDFVPKLNNDGNLTVAEIKQNLSDTYGIKVGGIPFVDGVADFSSISVANISTKDIALKSTGMSSVEYDNMDPHDRVRLLSKVFLPDNRSTNFTLADQIAAEKQIPIKGLKPGYTAAELAEWRKGKFTWDEQVGGGYNLVPTVIHQNISHTGLVGSSSAAVAYFEQRKNDDPNKYSFDEGEAPISLEEYLKKKKQ